MNMEMCGIDLEVNVHVTQMTLLMDDSELKMPKNGNKKKCMFLVLMLTFKRSFKPAMQHELVISALGKLRWETNLNCIWRLHVYPQHPSKSIFLHCYQRTYPQNIFFRRG